jgi:hypothetical protein
MEIADYATYDGATVMFDVMCFGNLIGDFPILSQPGVLSIARGHRDPPARRRAHRELDPCRHRSRPGIQTTLDLPLVTGSSVYRAP